jgi:chromosome partitioning protein
LRTIAIINQKGGCGKTTTAINLAAVLARRGERTLLVDLDPQSHCALGLAVPDSQIQRSTADLMRAGLDGSVGFDDVIWQISRGLDLAPSTMALAAVEQQLASAPDKDRRLSQILSTVQDQYAWCVIDCPPSIGLLTFNALRAAGEVIVPVETGYFALHGSIKQEKTIEMLARRVGHEIVFRVLPTMYDVRTKLAREILAELKTRFSDRLLPLVIHFNAKLKEAASFGQPITEYDPACRGMADFDELADYLFAHPPRPVATASASSLRPTSAEHPAMSRAAELVERARALANRAGAAAHHLQHDPDAQQEGFAPRSPDPGPPSKAPEPPADRNPPREQPADPPASAPAGGRLAHHLTHAHGRGKPVTPAATRAGDPSSHPSQPAAVHAEVARQAAAGGVSGVAGAAGASAEPSAASKGDLQARLAKLFGVRQTHQGLLFVQPGNGSHRLALAGDFNDWNPAKSPMRRDDKLGIWQTCIDLPPGRYRYRLVVDGKWCSDPYNQATEINAFGETDNVIDIPE